MQDDRVEGQATAAEHESVDGAPGDAGDTRRAYQAPVLTTIDARLSALLGSQCPIDPGTGLPAG